MSKIYDILWHCWYKHTFCIAGNPDQELPPAPFPPTPAVGHESGCLDSLPTSKVTQSFVNTFAPKPGSQKPYHIKQNHSCSYLMCMNPLFLYRQLLIESATETFLLLSVITERTCPESAGLLRYTWTISPLLYYSTTVFDHTYHNVNFSSGVMWPFIRNICFIRNN